MKKYIEYIVALIFVFATSILTSCQEFDQFDDNTERAVKYEKQFSSAIGTPAPHHAWGYDLASGLMGVRSASTRAILKQDMNVQTTDEKGNTVNMSVVEFYGKPADITQKEHDEVFAWFTNHRVNWDDPYANCGDGNTFTGSTRQFDGKAYTREGEEGYTMLDMGSLKTYSSAKIGTCTVDATIFFNGWLQYVNSDKSQDEIADDNANKYSCANMDNLKVVDSQTGKHVHVNEFNGAGGYGWGKQSGQNAILATECNFNEIEYSCSADSKYHDKYIIVHLIGSDYSGWYIGMDFEGSGPNNNMRVKADGVCNDWIMKVSDAGQSMFNPARILCEDLGSNDFDFNDVVFDVAAQVSGGCALATVTIKAVGGTIPVCITYGHPEDVEGKAFRKDGKFELHELFGAAVSQPINVHASGGLESSRVISWKIGFGKVYDEADYNYPDEQMDLQKFNVLVQHTNVAEWLTIRNYDEGNAVCAPQMICVPTIVAWPDENEPIVSKYTGFKDWVSNPTKFFWTGNTTNTQTQQGNTQQGNTQQPDEETQNPGKDETEETETPGTEETQVPDGTAVSFTNAGVSYSGMTCYAISKEELLKVSASGPYKITVTGKGKAYNNSSVQLVYDLAHPEWGSGQHQVTAFDGTAKSVSGSATDKAPVQVTTTLSAEQVSTLFSDSNFLGGTLLVAVSNMSDVKFYVE